MEILTNSPSWIELMQSCIDSEDIDKRVEMLERINRLVPKENMIKLPSFSISQILISKLLIRTVCTLFQNLYRYNFFESLKKLDK